MQDDARGFAFSRRKLIRAAGVSTLDTLVLNHLAPGDDADSRWRQAGKGFAGRLVVGHDLDEIPLGSKR